VNRARDRERIERQYSEQQTVEAIRQRDHAEQRRRQLETMLTHLPPIDRGVGLCD
jgi:hypothetical protein